VAADQDPALVATGQWHGNDRVDRLPRGAMILAHREYPSPREVQFHVRVAELPGALGRQRLWRGAVFDSIEALIAEIGGDDDAVPHRVGAPAILMHARAHVERRRR
jgi:hypothetical protein